MSYGLSPGDEAFEPRYLYVSAYPSPKKEPAVERALRSWNSRGDRGFVVPSQELAQLADRELVERIAGLVLELGRRS